jgi:hypothetical protein
MPPPKGIGPLWIFLTPSGESTIPKDLKNLSTKKVFKIVSKHAAK